jgi:hypothetical protein
MTPTNAQKIRKGWKDFGILFFSSMTAIIININIAHDNIESDIAVTIFIDWCGFEAKNESLSHTVVYLMLFYWLQSIVCTVPYILL